MRGHLRHHTSLVGPARAVAIVGAEAVESVVVVIVDTEGAVGTRFAEESAREGATGDNVVKASARSVQLFKFNTRY